MSYKKASGFPKLSTEFRSEPEVTPSSTAVSPTDRLQLRLITVDEEARHLRDLTRRRRHQAELEARRREILFLTALPPGSPSSTKN